MTETKTDSEMPRFGHIECHSMPELIKEMNNKSEMGYSPVWPSHKPLLFDKDKIIMILEYQEPIDTEEKRVVKAELSQFIMDAEFYVAQAVAELDAKDGELNANTNWKEESEKQENEIKTVKDKADYIKKHTKILQAKVDSYKSYLSHLKRLEKLGMLPEGNPPWIKPADPEPEKSEDYPGNSVELSGSIYCGLNMEKNCDKCLECEETGSE